jgi:hypothetical protein
VRRPGDGVEGGGGESSGAGSLGAQNWGKEERWEEGRKTIGRGLCVSESGQGGLAGPAKGRGPVASGGGGPMGGERGVGWPGWKERWAAAASNPKPGQNSKRNSFQISFDFRI